MINRNLGDYGYNGRDLRQGGGRGNGRDHVDDLLGSTELYIYQPPNRAVKGYESLKVYVESEGCEFCLLLMRLLNLVNMRHADNT
ncbi:MAG: hypothetical protein CM1200mP15_09030 [Dehalococcoidia bacterium]|nr:MAG: hypothetical protein CM1200mP15_09030 [Dehalococcoidia bacterium]